jgi:competence protein ComFB
MEEIVLEKVDEIFNEEEKLKRHGYCTCKQCRMDVACYVLNRIEPHYMLSSRGIAHLRNDYQENLQKTADLMGLINDGIRKISTTKRPHVANLEDVEEIPPEGPLFNFPTIFGRIFNGQNFEPLKNVDIVLLSEGRLVKMINANWQNPYSIVEKTAGNFSFWPYPVGAASLDNTSTFEFELFLEKSGFDEFHHYFEMQIPAQSSFDESFHMHRTYELEDLYVFPV